MSMIFSCGCSVKEKSMNTLIMKENEDMLMNTTASLRQTLRIPIDIEGAFHGNPPAEVRHRGQEFY